MTSRNHPFAVRVRTSAATEGRAPEGCPGLLWTAPALVFIVLGIGDPMTIFEGRVLRGPVCEPTETALVLHVHKARVVALEGGGDRAGLAVAVFGDDEVGLAEAGGLLVVDVVAVQQDHHVGILLQTPALT